MKKQTIIVFLLLLFSPLYFFGQDYCIHGKVSDSRSKKPLPFVNIIINDGKTGGSSDIDGKFRICSQLPISKIKLTYVGYDTKEIVLPGSEAGLKIQMTPTEYELKEVEVFPTENPAHRIINNVVHNRNVNDPEKLPAFSYTSYDKVIFTIEPDSILSRINTDTLEVDTSSHEFRKFLEEHHLFIMETVTERKFKAPDRNKEEIIASKISGLKDPLIIFLMVQIQNNSFYSERINIMDKNYINPISGGSTRKYFFLLQDTLYNNRGDSIYVISYRPRKNTNFDGLRGVLSINNNTWAIQNVIAEPAKIQSGVSMRFEQMYDFLENRQWFPVQLKTEVFFHGLVIDGNEASLSSEPREDAFDLPFGIGKTYIKDINLDPELKGRDFDNIEVEVLPDAVERDDQYWNQYRIDSLTNKERRTYTFLDSVSEAENFEGALRTFETLLSGEILWGFINFNLNDFIHYNDYEGLYLGVGAKTNHKIADWFRLHGFWGYGFKDKTAKYGGRVNFRLQKTRGIEAGFSYYLNSVESGGVRFFDGKENILSPDNFRNFMIKRMNLTESWQAYAGFRALRHFKFFVGFGTSWKKAFKEYEYGVKQNDVSLLMNEYQFTELTIGTRFAFKEKFIKTLRRKVSMGTKYPVVRFQYTKGFDNVLNGEFNYNRYDIQIDESVYFKYLGETKIRIRAGYIDGDLPFCNLYNGNGSYRTITLFAPYSFATMRMNEFLSNRYVALYWNHNFGKLLVQGNKFKPEFVILTNVAFGDLNNRNMHHNINYKTLSRGYYESGLLVNNLLDLSLYNIGLGAFYRYGPYSFSNVWDNFAWKISVVFAF